MVARNIWPRATVIHSFIRWEHETQWDHAIFSMVSGSFDDCELTIPIHYGSSVSSSLILHWRCFDLFYSASALSLMYVFWIWSTALYAMPMADKRHSQLKNFSFRSRTVKLNTHFVAFHLLGWTITEVLL